MRDLAVRFLERLFDQPRQGNATWHPLGFLHVAALPGDDAVRIHLWPTDPSPRAQHAAGTVHDHIWHLTSQVIWGTIDNVTLDAEPATEATATHETATVLSRGNTDEVIGTGVLVRLRETSHARIAVGSRYAIPVGELHQTRLPDGAPALTVVRARKQTSARPRTFLPAGLTKATTERVPATSREVRTALREIMPLLHEGAGRP